MTIRDYIRCYNKTFGYVEDKFGTDALKDLFATISREYCTHLENNVKDGQGVKGCVKYWLGDGNNKGTLVREKAGCIMKEMDGRFYIVMTDCPSIAEIRSYGQEPHHGKLTYCDHCVALYPPILEKYGIKMSVAIEYNEDGTCAGRCFNVIEII
jgi:hypothetical protein